MAEQTIFGRRTLRLTRGQDALVVESHDEAGVRIDLPQVDLSAFQLPVLAAAPEELQAHEAALAQSGSAMPQPQSQPSLAP
jgi:hypothetical protein